MPIVSAKSAIVALFLLAVSACSSPPGAFSANDIQVDFALLDSSPPVAIDYDRVVRPILESRCVVCHGCYDAPCQLKFSSAAGLARGASKEVVYDASRISAADPTRLFIDALTTAEWRDKGFHPVIAEGATQPYDRLDRSLMYRMLRLKQLYPQPLAGRLGPEIDTGLDRKVMCPTLDEFEEYARERPREGMPFALPNLTPKEYETLVHWLAQGSPRSPPPPIEPQFTAQIATWEGFLNGSSPKERLMARYLYEHLFQAHLRFEGDGARSFYTLERSSTPPGQPIVPIATRRPYGNPERPFHYRIRPLDGSVVAKDHVTYELSEARLARLRALFIEPAYEVKTLPGYETETAANPFATFAALPLRSRYEFLLDDARFFVEGFIKGPVCRGQIALNVIEDRFWILFVDPAAPLATNTPYINQLAELLAQPSEMESNLRLATSYGKYLRLQNRYLEARRQAFRWKGTWPVERAMSLLWNGGGTNPSAGLTVFRHYDNASVHFGLIGDAPKTAWVLDFPLLERIHYLLVAGFDVYGNVGHQLNTRLHMDVLRMEAENNLLAFLPAAVRKPIHDAWYTGIRHGDDEDVEIWWMKIDFVTGYRTADPLTELYQHATQYLGPLAKAERPRPCEGESCATEARTAAIASADRALQTLGRMRGEVVAFLPDVAFIRVGLGAEPEADLSYTLISDKSYANVSSMFSEQKPGERRDPTQDRQTVVPWLAGAYPEFFLVVDIADVESFATQFGNIQTRADAERFIERFGVRRTNPRFWETFDWFNAQALREEPERGGILDLNRYQNR